MKKIKCFLLEKIEPIKYKHNGKVKSPLYRRKDTGEEMTLREAPPGAIYRAEWYEDAIIHNTRYVGPDGKCYVCILPGGHSWIIDSRATNCTMPKDDKHKCWCRHGEAPNFTVNKKGNTCSAGAGSIAMGNYHGFLRNGYLEEC